MTAETREVRPSGSHAMPAGLLYALLVAVVLFWGANWPIMKVGLNYVPPLYFGTLRMGIGALCLFALLAVTRRFAFPAEADNRIVLSEAVLHMAAPMALMNIALLYVDAGRSSVLSFTTPLWVVPLAVFFLRDRLNSWQLAGVLLGLGGIGVLFGPSAIDWSDKRGLLGNGLLLLSALTWAVAILVARTQRWNLLPLQLAPWQMLLSAVLLAVPAALFEDWSEIQWNRELLLVLVFNGPVASAFCYWGALVIAKEMPPVMTSMAFLAVPVVGVLFSAMTLGEPVTASLAGGLAVILLGIALVNHGSRRPST